MQLTEVLLHFIFNLFNSNLWIQQLSSCCCFITNEIESTRLQLPIIKSRRPGLASNHSHGLQLKVKTPNPPYLKITVFSFSSRRGQLMTVCNDELIFLLHSAYPRWRRSELELFAVIHALKLLRIPYTADIILASSFTQLPSSLHIIYNIYYLLWDPVSQSGALLSKYLRVTFVWASHVTLWECSNGQ